MRIIILTLSIFISICVFGQNEKSFTTLDYKTVMIHLFDKVTYNARQEALWKPNYAERLNLSVSDDGFCHTVMDTTMYYTSGETKHAVVIFATYEYQSGVKVSCHACAPTLSIATFAKENGEDWQIVQFKKDFVSFGAWGKMLGRLGIEKLGEDFYCLKIQSAIDGNQGYERGITAYYSLNEYERFDEVFSYVYYDSNTGAMEVGKGYTEEMSIKILPAEDSYFGIELSSKRTDRKLIVKKKYKYSEEEQRYMAVCL